MRKSLDMPLELTSLETVRTRNFSNSTMRTDGLIIIAMMAGGVMIPCQS